MSLEHMWIEDESFCFKRKRRLVCAVCGKVKYEKVKGTVHYFGGMTSGR